jgi:hypothetical protein
MSANTAMLGMLNQSGMMQEGLGKALGSVGGAANPLGAISAGVGAITGIAQGLIGGRKRRREEREAQAEFNAMKSRYQALDTSNPYKNITNTFEDLTVNTQAAEFAQQQAEQSRADILGNLAASAGGGGIAALAQSLANQQTQAAQAAAASIGQQEQRNQMLAAQGEQRMQQMRGQGEYLSQQMEMTKSGNLLQMAAGRLQQAKQARQQATQSLIGGVAGIGSMAIGGAFKGLGGEAGAGLNVATSSIDSQAIASLNAMATQASNKLDLLTTPIQDYTPPTNRNKALTDLYNQRGMIQPVM